MSFRWGIFGTGAVAAKFVAGLSAARDARVAWVASRSQASADAFAGALGIGRAVEGYTEAVRAGGVDAIYIATPPALHLPHALAAIEAGIPVLVEKPFALDAAEARRIADAARTAGVFCMEGMWTRFLPAARRLRDLAASDAIGEIRQASGSFGFANRVDPANGNFDPARGGGSLAHLGVYPVSLGQWLFGNPVELRALGRIGETGVDEEAAVVLRYGNGVIASFHSSLRAAAANDFRLIGTHGSLALDGPLFRPHGVAHVRTVPRDAPRPGLSAKALLRERGSVQRLAQFAARWRPARARAWPYAGNGYHYEAEEVARCVAAGTMESPDMPLADSIAVAETLDQIRAAIGTGPSITGTSATGTSATGISA